MERMLMNSVVMMVLLAAPAQPAAAAPLTWKVTGSDVTFEMTAKDLRALRGGKEVFGLRSREKEFLSNFKPSHEEGEAPPDTSDWEGSESCVGFEYGIDAVKRSVAFHHLEGNKVAVRIAFGYASEACRGNKFVVGLLLPIPASLKPALERAAKREEGFLMKDAKAVHAPSVNFTWEPPQQKKR